MLLSAKEIKERKLLRRAINEKYVGASYNLTIGEIVTMEGKKHDEYMLPPRGMVLIVSHELFNMPDNIIGYTTVKNGLSINGIMAINIGIVDPEWNKPISSLIINFGSTSHHLATGETFLRITFHEYNGYKKKDLDKIENYSTQADDGEYKNYVKERRKQAMSNLSNTFLSISQIKKEIARKVMKRFLIQAGVIVVIISILGFLLSYSQDFMEFRKQSKQGFATQRIDSLNKRIEYLERKINFANKKQNSNEKTDSVGRNVERGMEGKGK
jgi:deoxycytidine triphosphate deaminase